jgi:hypothetical protein
MHLEGPWLSTTGRKRGPKKWASAEAKRKAEELDASWKELLKRQGIEQETKRQRRAMSAPTVTLTGPKVPPGRETVQIASRDTGWVPCTKSADKVYTGTKIKGIGTMHKSNAVPVFSDEEAVAIATMRR